MSAMPVFLDPGRKCVEALRLERELRSRVVDQDEAISQIVEQYQTYIAGLTASDRPISNLLLLGPTGCGKTRIVEAVAEALVGDRRAVIKIDCGEFQHSHEIAKLIGSPPGYLGHRETHARLSQERLDEFHTEEVKVSFVLFDEIEKASDALWNLLLGILDKGSLTLGDNRQVDFSNAMVFLTGNLGTAEMQRLTEIPLGFAAPGEPGSPKSAAKAPDLRLQRRMEKAVLDAARRKFSPEFLNRLDRIILCHALSEGSISRVLDLELEELLGRVQRQRGCRLRISFDETARNFLVTEGFDQKYGARHLKRSLEKHVVRPLSGLLATNQLDDGDELLISLEPHQHALAFQRDTRAHSRRSARDINMHWPVAAAAAGRRQWNAS